MAEEKIRVLQMVKGLGLGGTEKVMQLFACHLDNNRFETIVHSPADGERRELLREAGIDVRIGSDPLAILDAFRPHVVHLHRAGWPEPELLRPIKLHGPPVVVETNIFGRQDQSPSGKIIDCHLFVSHFCAARFEKTTGIPFLSPAYQVLYNPVDTDAYRDTNLTGPIKTPDFGRVSRPDPGKWSSMALETMPLIVKTIPEARFHVIGATSEARNYFRDQGLDRHVIYHDPALTDQDLSGFFSAIGLFAHANQTGESFGLAIAEAMAAGLPVVTHPSPGMNDNAQLELVEHGVTGLHASSIDEYASSVCWLLQNPEAATRMGEAGRKKAQRLFRAQEIAEQLGSIYLDLLESKKTGSSH